MAELRSAAERVDVFVRDKLTRLVGEKNERVRAWDETLARIDAEAGD